MLVLLSPAKSLDFDAGDDAADGHTEPLFPAKTAQLVERLRAMSAAELKARNKWREQVARTSG